MERRWWNVARIVAALAASAPGLWQLSLQLRLYLQRFRYPWDIEWLEGAALYQAYRIMRGQSTYAPPKAGYLPLFHPPGYPTVLGLLGHVIKLDYSVARTVSMLFFVAASGLVVRELLRHEETRMQGWVMGALAVGCAAAGVPLFQGFYDLIREDVMALFLVVLGAVLAEQKRPGPRRRLLLALVVAATVYTRFPYVFFLVWIVVFVFARNRKAGFSIAVGAIALCGLVLVALQYVSRGWFWTYTIAIYQDQSITRPRFMIGLKLITDFAPFIVATPIVALVLAIKKRLSARSVLWLGMFVCAIPAALLPFAKVGGFENDLMPAAFFAGPAAIFVTVDLLRALAGHPRVATVARGLVYVGFGTFLLLRTYDLKRFIPNAEAWRRAEVLNKRIASLEGGVISPRHAFVPIRDGHTNTKQFSDMPYLDAAWAGFSGLKLGAYIDAIHAKWALVSGTEVYITATEIAARYQLEGNLPPAPPMVIGERSTLRFLLKWQDDESKGHVLFDFEQPTLEGWTATGTAFERSPTPARPKNQGSINGVIGAQLANSFHPDERDPSRGTLTSPPFIIDAPHMGLRVGGGWRQGTRVELRVGGRTERTATGIWEYSETLTHVVWDVSRFQGQEARIVLIDDDKGSWGHLLCDHIVLY